MSKGLSKQQLQILGLAVAISRLRNGVPVARVPQPHPHWKVPVCTGVWPDVAVAIAAHVVGGVALRYRPSWYSRSMMWLETTPPALCARASLSRAITSLWKRECLAYRPRLWETERHFGDGYVLTDDGLQRGLPHEPTIPALDYRLWLLAEIKHGDMPEPVDFETDDRAAVLLSPHVIAAAADQGLA